MADLIRRKHSEPTTPARWDPFQMRWDPFEMMREMMSWDPFRAIDRGLGAGGTSWMPAFDLKETKEHFVLTADLPGVKEDDVELNVTGNRLTVSGKREAERRDEGDQQYVYERSYGSFMRTFTIPEGCDLDHISAELKDGVLKVVMPKKPEVQPRKISIQGIKEKVGKLKA